ncbi:MOSC domain-containing protein [Gordonia hydrophobica]|uniref:MOSC domain-containing protein n=1 Tax=Gordonia hydrophobica TaxID=40516 RepID=A0ABZ2TVE2_9ACTN|nr:MOSC domain-containing protein [Gordonia hydrophobica]MBM7366078.1 MOSC domain-containing protein YiiM [Gordonia hydrophobica]
MAEVTAICVVARLHPDSGAVGTTAIDKRPVDGPVRIGEYGVYGDVQADRKHHGGPDKALYAYAQEDADFWATELGREIPLGFFGENLRTVGIDVNGARIGERWRIGATVIVEVTSPRIPCQTFARWMGDDGPGWVKRFAHEGRVGPYLRVVERGSVEAGDEITVVSVPDDGPTIREVSPR